MLGFVAIVFLIATTAAYIPEYTEDTIKKFNDAHPESEVLTAELYNADNGMKFRVDNFFIEFGLSLVPVHRPDRTEARKEHCGKLFGIHLNHVNKNFCKMTFLLFTVLKEEDSAKVEEHIRFSLFFDDDNKPPLVIDTPVYKIPAEYASADEAKLRKWAAEKKVGVFAPVNNLLGEVKANKEWKSDFTWLSDLVSYGIFRKKATHLTTELYSTHPLVLSDAEIEKIFQVIEEERAKDSKM